MSEQVTVKRVIGNLSHIVKIADPAKLSARIEYQMVSAPEEGEEDQRPVYHVAVYLEEES